MNGRNFNPAYGAAMTPEDRDDLLDALQEIADGTPTGTVVDTTHTFPQKAGSKPEDIKFWDFWERDEDQQV